MKRGVVLLVPVVATLLLLFIAAPDLLLGGTTERERLVSRVASPNEEGTGQRHAVKVHQNDAEHASPQGKLDHSEPVIADREDRGRPQEGDAGSQSAGAKRLPITSDSSHSCVPPLPLGFCPLQHTNGAKCDGSELEKAAESHRRDEIKDQRQSADKYSSIGKVVRDLDAAGKVPTGAVLEELTAFLRNDACRLVNPKSMDNWTASLPLRGWGVTDAALNCATPQPLAVASPTNPERVQQLDLWLRQRPTAYPLLRLGDLSPLPAAGPSTTYSRRGRAAWISMTNVCASCSAKGSFFLNRNRRCHFTLHSLGTSRVDKIGPNNRNGRHSIFFEREGAFQYAGAMSRAEAIKRGAKFVPGTTFLNAPLAIENVGHMLHDGHWAFNAMMIVAATVGLPKPFRVLQDADYYRHTGEYLAFLNGMAAEHAVGGESVFVNPLSEESEQPDGKLLCFESLAISGGDRTGNNGGHHEGRRWAVAGTIRSAVLGSRGLAIPEAVTEGRTLKPQLAVYGRNDVYRRSVENIDALAAMVLEVTKSLGLPDPLVIDTFDRSPASQIALVAKLDMLVTVQGAHLQHSLFMPKDAVIYEIAPCFAGRTSFVARYGMFLPRQRHVQTQICRPMFNFGGNKYGQNLTLCPEQLIRIRDGVADAAKKLVAGRKDRRK